jgi:hypothetical protein
VLPTAARRQYNQLRAFTASPVHLDLWDDYLESR